MKHLLVAGLAAWVGAGMAFGAEGMVYRQFGLLPPTTLDLDLDGTDDFQVEGDGVIFTDTGFFATFLFSGLNGLSFSSNGGDAVAVADGASIGPSSGWWSAPGDTQFAAGVFVSLDEERTWSGMMEDGGSRTIAVRFAADGGGHHYGWMRFREHDDGGTEFGPQIFDLAYNSVPDQPILSAIVPVPEPGTASLALGGLALLGWARRRRVSR